MQCGPAESTFLPQSGENLQHHCSPERDGLLIPILPLGSGEAGPSGVTSSHILPLHLC